MKHEFVNSSNSVIVNSKKKSNSVVVVVTFFIVPLCLLFKLIFSIDIQKKKKLIFSIVYLSLKRKIQAKHYYRNKKS